MADVKIPGIPDPGGDLQSVIRTVRALKQAVDKLSGNIGSDSNKARISVQDDQPSNPRIGDLWIGSTGTNYWNGTSWEGLP